jgi:hypothetical protein
LGYRLITGFLERLELVTTNDSKILTGTVPRALPSKSLPIRHLLATLPFYDMVIPMPFHHLMTKLQKETAIQNVLITFKSAFEQRIAKMR